MDENKTYEEPPINFGSTGKPSFTMPKFNRGRLVWLAGAAVAVLIGWLGLFYIPGQVAETKGNNVQTDATTAYMNVFSEIDACTKKSTLNMQVAQANAAAFRDAITAFVTNAPGAADITQKGPFTTVVSQTLPDFKGSQTVLFERVQLVVNDCIDATVNSQKVVSEKVADVNSFTGSFLGRHYGEQFPNERLKVIAPGGKVIANGQAALDRMSAPIVGSQAAESVKTGINEGPSLSSS